MSLVLLISSALLCTSPSPGEDFTPHHAQAEQIELLSALLATRTDHFAREETLHIAVTLVRAAERHDLDPRLLLAMIEVESSYGRRGQSPVGALGLMQLLPSTAEAFAKPAGVKWRGPRTLFEPETNIEIGATYFAYLLSRFEGDRELALAAYCHGPAAIRRSLRANGGLSPREKRYGRRVLDRWQALQDTASNPRAQS